MLNSRHVNEETSGQCDVRRDARALLRNRLLRDLDEYLLAFAQQVRDRGLVSLASRLVTAISTLLAFLTPLTPVTPAWLTRARFWRRRRRRRRGGYDLFRLCKRYRLIVLAVRLSFYV